jgi:hypothetical protein
VAIEFLGVAHKSYLFPTIYEMGEQEEEVVPSSQSAYTGRKGSVQKKWGL